MIRIIRKPKATAQLSFDFDAPIARPAAVAKPVKAAKAPRAPKPAKLTAYEIAENARHAAMTDYMAALTSEREALVAIARSSLLEYHHNALAGDETVMDDAAHRVEAVAWKLYGATAPKQYHLPDSAFGCMSDARHWLMDQLAAPAGQVPMFGQQGRFVLPDVAGCRVDYRYEGLFGICGGNAHIIDLDRPFFSETGYRSFQVCHGHTGYGYVLQTGGLGMVDYMTRVLTAQLLANAATGKKKGSAATIKLHKPPFGLLIDGRSDDYLREERASDPAYQPGGHLHALLTVREAVTA